VAAAKLEADLHAAGAIGRSLRHDLAGEAPLPEALLAGEPDGVIEIVHCATVPFVPAPFHTMPWSEVEAQLGVAVRGVHLLARQLAPRMVRGGGGAIVAILSTVAHGTPPKGFSAYVIAKRALGGLIAALAVELRPRGIRIFTVSPRYMDTALTAAWDARLRDAARSAGMSEPTVVADRVRALLDDPATPGEGEDYVA
jgi:3-oxoacyl-[acyl-carrier protein] reductase